MTVKAEAVPRANLIILNLITTSKLPLLSCWDGIVRHVLAKSMDFVWKAMVGNELKESAERHPHQPDLQGRLDRDIR
jgi:hypothetical protein